MMKEQQPELKIREVVDACADCDVCRYLMDTACLMFPTLYRLYDKEMETGEKITREELRNLADLCNYCALCPCPNVREDIMLAKTAFINRDGLKYSIRLLEDVGQIGRLCGASPRLSNLLFQGKLTGKLLKKATGIHEERKIPLFPQESFSRWAKRHHWHTASGKKQGRGVAYFSGCTGRYLFPKVPRAVVEVFQHNGINVFYPEQKCCGMPTLLEGDSRLTLQCASFNVERLAEAVEEGYDIVYSCPTCGYMFKNVLKEGACYSSECRTLAQAGRNCSPANKSVYEGGLKDEGYFASIDPRKRILVAENSYDLGEYLRNLHKFGRLKTTFGPLQEHVTYYPPCHLREQNIGQPYLDLMGLIPGISIEPIEGSFYCCGIAGIMGFKREFFETSVKMGEKLMEKVKEIHPERLITDCLSCRLQFNQLVPYEVFHPIEILRESYSRA